MTAKIPPVLGSRENFINRNCGEDVGKSVDKPSIAP